MPAPGSGCQDIAAPWLVADQKRFIKGNNWWEVSSNEFPVSGGESPDHGGAHVFLWDRWAACGGQVFAAGPR